MKIKAKNIFIEKYLQTRKLYLSHFFTSRTIFIAQFMIHN